MRPLTAFVAALAVAIPGSALADTPAPAWRIPSDDRIAQLIDARIAARPGEGIVIGIVEPGARRIVARGPAGAPPFDGGTVFEIGSITKVFTGLILADMAVRGELSIDNPARMYLPQRASMPERDGREISLRDLALHRSGLPRLATNMPAADAADPYADYSDALMLAFLAGYRLPRPVGAQFEYSNFGGALLGYLLGRAAHADYASVLRDRITGPLGMNDTSIALSPDQAARLAPGFGPDMQPASSWHFVQPGAGGVRSTVADMLRFAAAVLDPRSPIAPALKLALAARLPADAANSEQALGWQIAHPERGRDILLHDGATGGYRAMIALEPATGRGVVALANSSAEPGVDDLALHVLLGAPLERAAVPIR